LQTFFVYIFRYDIYSNRTGTPTTSTLGMTTAVKFKLLAIIMFNRKFNNL